MKLSTGTLVFLAAGLLSCSASPQSGQSGSDPSVADTSATPEQSDPVVQTPQCAAQAVGAVSIAEFDLLYHNQPASLTVRKGDGGCLVGVDAVYGIDAGCRLALSAQVGQDGHWRLIDGTFDGDAHCGDSWPSDLSGSFLAVPDASAVAPTRGAEPGDEATCVASDLAWVGKVRLRSTSDAREFDVNLNNLGAGGDALVETVGATACAQSVEHCAQSQCGDDAYGVSCGVCDAGFACEEGGCVESSCPPLGPFGTSVGDVASDVVLPDCDGNDVHVHDLCGQDAGFFYLAAGS